MNVPDEALPDQPQAETGDEKRTPIASFQFPGSSGSTVETAIWENPIDLPDGQKGIALAVSFSRSYRKGEGWKRTSSYRLHDLFALGYAIQKSIAWLLENKAKS